MKKKVWRVLPFTLLGILIIASSCGIVITDPDETIIIQNRSGKNSVEVYIDDDFKGIVDDGRDLEIIGDYDGNKKFYVKTGIYQRGPEYYDVPKVGGRTWELNPRD